MGDSIYIKAIRELNDKYHILNNKCLIVILGEGKKCPISRFFYKNNDIITIDPLFADFKNQKYITNRFPKKIRMAWIPEKSENIKIRNVLLKYKGLNSILLVSFNAHTHFGKFFDRICTSSPKIHKSIKLYAIGSCCHNPGLYKRQITNTLLYPESRRNGTYNGGWLLNVNISVV